MSYGKSKANLSKVPTYNQQRRLVNGPPRGGGNGGGGGNRPHWVNQYKPIESARGEPDRIHIPRFEYKVPIAVLPQEEKGEPTIEEMVLNYVPYYEHGTQVNGVYTSFICSGGPLHNFKNLREPCRGCDIYWQQEKDKRTMKKSPGYAFPVLHLGWYAKLPQLDRKTGKPRTNDNGEPYMEWVRSSERQLRNEHANAEQKDHNYTHWALGWNDYKTVNNTAYDIGKNCRSCAGESTMRTLEYICMECGNTLLDPESTAFTEEEKEKLIEEDVRCNGCGHIGMMEEIIACDECNVPVRSEIFDVDMYVRKPLDEKTKKTGSLVIANWEGPVDIDPRFFTGEKPIVHQLDLLNIFKGTPIEEQEKKLSGMGGGGGGGGGGRQWRREPTTLGG